ncbi:MAG: bifunctional hydroxymethylpyrimidine kinase/phosphomethylpyrimidine kinase [Deltaproteobacteria bacterium]|nr:bifunctional hydroxymethylpyrimidine kinase/phosphomethylpyrimidine kinase [Deltaproteobacteria bacterium]MBI2341312.1 bifunctional hydroxymethylpyrimidine kinase/phosphomethylpyrimidine kinase [Deltaproteobacteria bacterium]
MPTVLTIAGSDPSGGAGIQADLAVFEAFGVRGLSAITAVTAQTKDEVLGVNPVAADILNQQLASASKNASIDALKIGMIGSSANVMAIILFLRSQNINHIVIDPVFKSTSGTPLLESHALKLFKESLLPLATLITPNTDEAGVLTGMRIWNVGTMKDAAQKIYSETWQLRRDKIKPLSVLIKGGHLGGDSTDVLFDGESFKEFNAKRINVPNKRGTGCRLSAAIASGLANGKSTTDAITAAKKYVEDYIRAVTSCL